MAVTKSSEITVSTTATNRTFYYRHNNQFVVDGDKIHAIVQNYNGDDPYVINQSFETQVATYDVPTGTIDSITTIGDDADNHGVGAITIDNDGYLWVFYSPHHNIGEKRIRFRKSNNPNDSTAWGTETFISTFGGAYYATYPSVAVDSSNNIHLVGSYMNSCAYWKINSSGSVIYNKVIYDKGSNYIRYDNGVVVGSDDSIHIFSHDVVYSLGTVDFRATTTVRYHKSTDGGDNFAAEVSVVTPTDGYWSCGSYHIDSNNNPHFFAYNRNETDNKNCYHIFYNGSSWVKNTVFSNTGDHVWLPNACIDKDDNIFITWQQADSEDIYLYDGDDSVNMSNKDNVLYWAKASATYNYSYQSLGTMVSAPTNAWENWGSVMGYKPRTETQRPFVVLGYNKLDNIDAAQPSQGTDNNSAVMYTVDYSEEIGELLTTNFSGRPLYRNNGNGHVNLKGMNGQ